MLAYAIPWGTSKPASATPATMSARGEHALSQAVIGRHRAIAVLGGIGPLLSSEETNQYLSGMKCLPFSSSS